MDLNGYFDPVSLERPGFHFLPEKYSFSRNMSVHTPNEPIGDISDCRLALIGIPQDSAGFIKGSAQAPDKVRGMLYQLRQINNNIKVCDLGNLKITENINDTYYAVRDLTLELIEKNIIPFFIGGSQDLTFGILLAMEKIQGLKQILTVDPRLDFTTKPEPEISSRNYLNYLIDPEIKSNFTYTNIGHQQYFVAREQLDMIEREFMETLRLGELRENIRLAEPLIRDADAVSIDMNSVRHSDAPGVTIPSPNGLFGDEICSISRYAGLSEKVKVCGIFECSPGKDLNNQTSHLAAQATWYFIEGLSNRLKENPLETSEHTKKFIITPEDSGQELVFIKSNLSERWWLEVPINNPQTKRNFFISCSYEDYQKACNNLIPERWWRYLNRLGN